MTLQNTEGFGSLGLNKQLLQAIADLGFKSPMPIQSKAIPQILAGHDIIGIAPTGTGKTLAYGLPALMKIKFAEGNFPRVLILGPTKELIIQIHDHIMKMARHTDLRVLALFGGVGPSKQIDAIENGVDMVAATPGRFLDLYSKGYVKTRSIEMMILDEADKLMDMGFMPQIRRILEIIPTKRQNLLFSATMPPKVEDLMNEFLEFPQRIEVAPQSTTASTIDQCVYYLPNLKTKIHFLNQLLKNSEFKKVLVFVKTKQSANDIFKFLDRKFPDEGRVIHANKSQNSRLNAISSFEAGAISILVSTDVTARGIDVTEVSHVINFDVPVTHEDYVHRIGRTGRAFKAGTSITFVNEAEVYHLRKIEEIINEQIPAIPVPPHVEIYETAEAEKQQMARAIDHQRRLEDPEFKGAFHEKKRAGSGRRQRKKGRN